MDIPQCPRTDDRLNKMQSVRMVGYYSARKRNDILTQASPYTSHEGIMLRGQSRAQQAIKFRFHEMSRRGRFMGTESRWVVAKSWQR